MIYLLILDFEDTVTDLADETGLIGQLPRFGLQNALQVILALLVVSQTNGVKLAQDLFDAVVAFETAVGVEEDHRRGGQSRLELEEPVQAFPLSFLQFVLDEVDAEADGRVRVVFFVVVDERALFLRAVEQRLHDRLFVRLRPHANGQFRDFDFVVAQHGNFAADRVAVRVDHFDGTSVACNWKASLILTSIITRPL